MKEDEHMNNMKPNPYRFKDYPEMDQNTPVTAKEIADEFRYDRSEAMDRYSEKRLYVTGVVSYAGPDMFGLPSLELSDNAEGPTDCLCVFNEQSSISNIQEGDTVTVQGNFIDCVPDYGPTFKKCVVTETER